MNIRIKSLTLTNFKCFHSKELTFNDDITVIRGRNGVGKTTIADAILWCLFGKNTQGQSDFDLKTHDENGKPIPNLDHSVEMVLSVGCANITLKRTLKETWMKKRGSDEQVFKNNTTEYMVNGEVKTATDYKRYIAELVSEDIFRAITNPAYFPSLKWQQQREFLTALVPDAGRDSFAGDEKDDGLQVLYDTLSSTNEDIVSYRKHLSYQIKGIKDKLEKIPVRLEEQNKALPEKLNWDALTNELFIARKELQEVDEKFLSIKSGNGIDVRKEELRSQLNNLQDTASQMEENIRKCAKNIQAEHDNKVSEVSRQFSQLIYNQRDLEGSISSFDTLIARCNETLKQCDLDAAEIRKRWADNLARSISFSESDNICPTCGQYLPEGQLQERKEKAMQQLNESKANIKAKLTEQAGKVKQLIAEANEQIEAYKSQKEEAEKNLAETKESINKVFSEKAKLEKEPLPSYEEMMAEDNEYQEVKKQIAELQQQIKNASVQSEEDVNALHELSEMRASLLGEIDAINTQLSTRVQYDKILALIDGINEEQKDLVRQLSELERKEDVARNYQDRMNQILEERINQHFSVVQWKMFRTVNNGGDPFQEPYCECYVDGVAYHDGLNQAARLNAGLDILNTLCKHYNVSAPIVIDNAESTINILDTIGQQIRLEVADTDLNIV